MTKTIQSVRFECQGSGKCCTSRGSYGFVYLTSYDRKRLAGVLGLSLKDFTLKHCEKTDGLWHLRNPDQDCEFLSGKACGVYKGRPLQCRTWPFWPENLSPKAWSKEVASFCPGVGKGRLYTAKEIRKIASRNPI